MQQTTVLPALSLCTLLAAAPSAAASFSGTLAGFIDDADGTSLDLDVRWEPVGWLALAAGVGSAESSSELADLRGDSLRAAIELRGEHLGGRLGWRNWQDAGDFESDALTGELYWHAAGWQIGLIAERRDFSVDYTVLLLGRPAPRTASFTGEGYGAQLSWYGERWGGYLRAVGYDYDAALERAIAAARAPNLARFPRIQALVGSLLTRTAGAIDYDLAAGVERTFQRSALRVDVASTRDAISGTGSRSTSLGYRYSLTSRLDVEATVGTVDSSDLDAVGFAGLALTFRN